MPAKRQRLDQRVVELGLFPSRQVAQTAIMDGWVLVDGQRVTKPGTNVSIEASIGLVPGHLPRKYVSRGGLKLEKALLEFGINPDGRICLDIGASTGGFTDCLLKHGAVKVYAVDVGYGQLDWSLRQDPRVVVRERVNARALTPAILYEPDTPWADLAVIDVSFISILKVLPAAVSVLDPRLFDIIALIKPQFEAGKAFVQKGGVVLSPLVHETVLESVLSGSGLVCCGVTFSPVKGPAGNIEFLAHFSGKGDSAKINLPSVVQAAHSELSLRS